MLSSTFVFYSMLLLLSAGKLSMWHIAAAVLRCLRLGKFCISLVHADIDSIIDLVLTCQSVRKWLCHVAWLFESLLT